MIKARLGSGRMKHKMIRPFAGSTLLEIALRKVQDCKMLSADRIYLGAYEKEIKAIGEKVGVNIYDRPAVSVSDKATMKDLYSFIWTIDAEYFLEINPCNPLLRPETVDAALEAFQANDYSSLFSVIKKRNYFFDENSALVNEFLGDKRFLPILDTKMIGPLYEAAHSIYIWSADRMKKELNRWSFTRNDPFLFVMPEEEAFDVDYEWQFDLAQCAYTQCYGKFNKGEKGGVAWKST